MENPDNSVYLESQSDVQNYTDTFDQLRASALSPAETRTRLIRTAE
ncbi:Scr1 family TA system antitoxin-like transcriptional regulator [Streptomyces sp. ECR3.8]